MSLPLAFVVLGLLGQIGKIALLLLGFGFVIFWHELGHFLAAKFVGIRVRQFAVGYWHALFSWRKGIGFRIGNTQKEYRARAEQYLDARRPGNDQPAEKVEYTDEQIFAAGDELGLGQTEYRLNWVPLGGYVMMLGQDDLKPDAVVDNPQAFTKKSVSARMLVISAGVIMNVILAAIGFMVLFIYGFNVPPAWVGNVVANSPAEQATIISGLPTDTPGIHVGDRILLYDGALQQDFTKITLNTALTREGEPVTMVVNRPNTPEASRLLDPAEVAKNFHQVKLSVTPKRRVLDDAFLAIGFEQPHLLQGPAAADAEGLDLKDLRDLYPSEVFAILPGDTITAVNGQAIKPTDFVLFDQIVQNSFGKPITLTIRNAAGQERTARNNIHFADTFNPPFHIAGMVPRVSVFSFPRNSVARGDSKLHLGDVIVSTKTIDNQPAPSREQLIDSFNKAGNQDRPIDMVVMRDGKQVTVSGLKATIKLPDKNEDETRFGIGVSLIFDEKEAVVADVTEDSPAKKAGLQKSDRILTVNSQPVQNWFDVQRMIAQWSPGKSDAGIPITYARENVAEARSATLPFTPDQLNSVRGLRYETDIQEMGWLADYIVPRKTSNVLTAAHWGVTETRDFILQFYVTIRRMLSGSVSTSNMMGPLGIAWNGSKIAFKGYDWLLWFLCMISANLAVVNFLPIPVVDGGQFVFLIVEKIKGKPLSSRAISVAQYVGLVFLAGLVLFVTYHDIVRMVRS